MFAIVGRGLYHKSNPARKSPPELSILLIASLIDSIGRFGLRAKPVCPPTIHNRNKVIDGLEQILSYLIAIPCRNQYSIKFITRTLFCSWSTRIGLTSLTSHTRFKDYFRPGKPMISGLRPSPTKNLHLVRQRHKTYYLTGTVKLLYCQVCIHLGSSVNLRVN